MDKAARLYVEQMEDSIQYREEEEEEEAENKERPDWRQQREEIWKQEMYNPHRIG